ncbi:MAG: ATP-binding cassette domain-containing protein [Chthoniobacterales bacterium]|nr:ATP-binding cassette domain-containing protein [Chthoniobacterales bacterium]MBJ7390032.1 ATP-binding cassette domain-containing protein [Chthoniobacterales bacterium]
MRAWLHCETESGSWDTEIEGRTLFLDLGGEHGLRRETLAAATVTDSTAFVRLDLGTDGAWTVQASPQAEIFANDTILSRPRSVQTGALLQGEGWSAVLHLEYAPPLFRGQPFEEIPLAGLGSLVIGRHKSGESAGDRIDLDEDLQQISRSHVSIERRGLRFVAKDTSRSGATLNGQRFDERELVVGDRLIVGPYSFEFTGRSLRKVRPRIGAEITASGVGVDAGGRTILDGVSVQISACSFVGILGGSGQGKSTLMTAVCGIRPPTRGKVTIDGIEMGANAEQAPVGYVPQDDIVHVELTVEQAIRHSAKLRLDARIPRAEIDALVDEIIGRLGLEEHRGKRINRLSGGQRKRVSIATELLAKPAALFLDEPSSGLDPATEYHLMRLLRHLAAADCTVVCTTHVLGRAYLFDRLLFIHGGRLVFDGTPEEAREFFGAESLDMVYIKLDEGGETATQVEQRFKQWREVRGGTPELAGGTLPRDATLKKTRRGLRGDFAALLTQLARLRDITASDRMAMVYMLAQPVLIALLIGWVAEDYVLRIFLCLVAVLWFGCSNGAQQIVKERPVFAREKICGVGTNPYLLSKYKLHGAVTTAQGLLLFLVVQTTAMFANPPLLSAGTMIEEMMRLERDRAAEVARAEAPREDFAAVEEGRPAVETEVAAVEARAPRQEPGLPAGRALAARAAWFCGAGENVLEASRPAGAGFWHTWFWTIGLKMLALACTALVGVAMGLAISGLVQTGTQAVLWVPLILIPQILLGGVVLVRPELSAAARGLAQITPSFSAQRIFDVSNVYGLTVPFLSNRTKLPVFLTPGEKQRIEWESCGKNYSQSYDRISTVNRSWQNLLVYPDVTGQHVNTYDELVTEQRSKRKLFHDTTDTRNDVKYRKGTVYDNLRPAAQAAVIIFVWVGLCYATTVLALRRTAVRSS